MTTQNAPAQSGENRQLHDVRLPLAVAAYLARYKGLSRTHTDSDLRAFLHWCGERRLSPLDARRVDLELYVRWMQEVRGVQAVDGLPPHLRGRRVLPNLRH